MQTRCTSGNYCNSYLKEGLFPEDVNGDLARGCLCERLAILASFFMMLMALENVF